MLTPALRGRVHGRRRAAATLPPRCAQAGATVELTTDYAFKGDETKFACTCDTLAPSNPLSVPNPHPNPDAPPKVTLDP